MDSLPAPKQARGLALAYSGSSIGAILAPLIFTPIAAAYGWRPAFLVTPALAIIWLIVWRTTVDPAKFPHKAQAQKLRFPSLLERRFWSLVFSYSFGSFPVGAITYMSPLLLSRAFGLSQKQLGEVLWIPPVGLELGFFFWGWIADRFYPGHPRPRGLIIIMATLCLPIIAIPWFNTATMAIALLTFTLFASAGMIVVTLRTGGLAYPTHQRSMAAGIASSSFSATVAVILPFLGKFFDHHDYQSALTVVAVLPLLGTLIWLILPVHRPEGTEA